jgi:hypothetical protein
VPHVAGRWGGAGAGGAMNGPTAVAARHGGLAPTAAEAPRLARTIPRHYLDRLRASTMSRRCAGQPHTYNAVGLWPVGRWGAAQWAWIHAMRGSSLRTGTRNARTCPVAT